MAPNIWLRLGAVGLLGLAVSGAAFALRGSKDPQPIRTLSATVPADPLATELIRCRDLGLKAAGDPTWRNLNRHLILK